MSFLSFEEFAYSKFFIGLYCERIRHDDGTITHHSGIICRLSNGSFKLFHFAWHKRLHFDNGIPRNKSVYIGLNGYDAQIDPRRINTDSFINLFSEVYDKNKDSILYGLALSKLTTFIGGQLHTKEGAIGVTCSTFIMTFFQKFDLELIEYDSWESRPEEDEEWKQSMLAFMALHNVEEEHIETIREEKLMFRFKPEEVISSGLKYPKNLKADFAFCTEEGPKIKTILSC